MSSRSVIFCILRRLIRGSAGDEVENEEHDATAAGGAGAGAAAAAKLNFAAVDTAMDDDEDGGGGGGGTIDDDEDGGGGGGGTIDVDILEQEDAIPAIALRDGVSLHDDDFLLFSYNIFSNAFNCVIKLANSGKFKLSPSL
jgi:hypothetical protein